MSVKTTLTITSPITPLERARTSKAEFTLKQAKTMAAKKITVSCRHIVFWSTNFHALFFSQTHTAVLAQMQHSNVNLQSIDKPDISSNNLDIFMTLLMTVWMTFQTYLMTTLTV